LLEEASSLETAPLKPEIADGGKMVGGEAEDALGTPGFQKPMMPS